MHESIIKSIFFGQRTHVWKNLHNKIYQGHLFRVVDLQEALYKLTQNTILVSFFYNQLKTIGEEIDNFRLFVLISLFVLVMLLSLQENINNKIMRFVFIND